MLKEQLKTAGGWKNSQKKRMDATEKKVMAYGYVKAKHWSEAMKEIDKVIEKYR